MHIEPEGIILVVLGFVKKITVKKLFSGNSERFWSELSENTDRFLKVKNLPVITRVYSWNHFKYAANGHDKLQIYRASPVILLLMLKKYKSTVD